ncbi:MAG: site-specific integrase [Deltaproteobacteria bacterium]|nr:site-specific integrase [Deltaproteobacteria bacterium]
MAYRTLTKYKGVFERYSQDRLYKGKPDVCFDIRYKLDGKDIFEKVGWASEGYTAKQAENVRIERLRTMRHGEELPQQKKKAITFEALAKKYLKWSAVNKSRDGIDDESRYENHLKDRFANKRLDEISTFDLERLKSDMVKKDYAPKTISHCLGLIRAMYNKAMDWDLYHGANPIKKKRPGEKKGLMPVVQNARDRFLSIEEADILLKELRRNPRYKKEHKELEDPKLHDITLLSLHTGARASEIFNLKGYDADLKNGLLTLRDTKNTETRYAPMTEAVHDMINRRLPKDLNAYIFTDEDGQKIKEVSNSFERVVNRLGFNDGVTDPRQRVVFHSCRHSFASWLAIQGTPLYTIAKLMGHKSISMSERYSHLSPDHKKDAVNGLKATFNHTGKIRKIEGK